MEFQALCSGMLGRGTYMYDPSLGLEYVVVNENATDWNSDKAVALIVERIMQIVKQSGADEKEFILWGKGDGAGEYQIGYTYNGATQDMEGEESGGVFTIENVNDFSFAGVLGMKFVAMMQAYIN